MLSLEKTCEWCGEVITSEYIELYDQKRNQHYCDRCFDEYWKEVEESEGIKMD